MIKLKGKAKIDEDLGFGSSATTNNQRLLNKNGTSNIKRKGLPFFKPHEAYNSLIHMSWNRFWIIVFLSYFLMNVLFAFIYFFLGLENLNGSTSLSTIDQFADA